jgi:hypothetical protein
MKTTFLIFVLLLLSLGLNANPPDSCLKMIWDNDYDNLTQTGGVNPDSVRIDSCLNSPTFEKLFAKRYFYLNFKVNNFPFDYQLKPDSIKRVSDISSSKPELKAQFQQLESQFGTIYFQGRIYFDIDSEFWLNPGCRMYFDNYQNIDEVIDIFTSTIDSLSDIHYVNRALPITSVEEIGENENNIQIYPNPVKNILDLKLFQISSMDIISIYSLYGLKVKESEYKEQINISDLQPGIYFLKFGNKIFKFIKQD